MDYALKSQTNKRVIGVQIRTSNENGRFLKEVPPLWEKFRREALAEKIPHRVNQDVMAVYSGYESDYTKPFDYMIGCEVSEVEAIPEGMIAIEIPAANYAVFTPTGEFPQSMWHAWQAIWKSDVKRAYTIDFEIYPKDHDIKIYIAAT